MGSLPPLSGSPSVCLCGTGLPSLPFKPLPYLSCQPCTLNPSGPQLLLSKESPFRGASFHFLHQNKPGPARFSPHSSTATPVPPARPWWQRPRPPSRPPGLSCCAAPSLHSQASGRVLTALPPLPPSLPPSLLSQPLGPGQSGAFGSSLERNRGHPVFLGQAGERRP